MRGSAREILACEALARGGRCERAPVGFEVDLITILLGKLLINASQVPCHDCMREKAAHSEATAMLATSFVPT